jgi:hypothetical protein
MISQEGTDFALRAGQALEALLPERDRDKAIARLFNCSVRMAKYLRTGQSWTVERLGQASAALGEAFDRLVFGGALDDTRLAAESEAIHQRIAEQQTRIRELEADLAHSRELVRLATELLRVQRVQRGQPEGGETGQ